MKPARFLGLALLITPLAAQTGQSFGVVSQMGPGGLTKTINLPNPCPVGLAARHLVDGDMVKTARDHPKGLGQRLHVTLTSPDARTPVRATFNVRGWTAQGQMEPTSHNSSQAVRTLQVPLTPGTNRSASTDLWAPGLTAVDRVELLSLAYADGSTWTPPAGKSCGVAPDPLMLIAK